MEVNLLENDPLQRDDGRRQGERESETHRYLSSGKSDPAPAFTASMGWLNPIKTTRYARIVTSVM